MILVSSFTNVVAYIFMTYVILVTTVISNVFQIVLMRPFSLTVYRKVVSFCQYLILSQLSLRFDWWGQSETTFYISDADRLFLGKETAVIVMNHRNSAEHLFCFAIAERLGLLRVALHSPGFRQAVVLFCEQPGSCQADYIKYIPTAGWSLFFNESIFLKWSYEKDRGLIVKQLEELQTYTGVFWLLFYCEGTRFTAERHQTSMEVAQNKGLPELKHHLLPRTKGFTLCARVGKKYIQAFYDVEYHFNNDRPEPTMMDLLKGKAQHVHVYFRTHYEYFERHGRFPEKTYKIPRRPHPLLVFISMSVLLVMPPMKCLCGVILTGSSYMITGVVLGGLLAAIVVFWGEHVGASDFDHHETLDVEGKFRLFWKFDDEKIELEAQVQTTGWVGLGLSPNGGMPRSDIAIGWVKDGTAHLTDRYAEAKAQPRMDESQDWELVSGYENETHTVLRFNRKLTTCDVRDRVINEDTMRLLWAWHDDDPEDESGASGPTYHGVNRGVKSTVLLSNIVTPTIIEEALNFTFDIVMNNNIGIKVRLFLRVQVPVPYDKGTTYWCRVFQLPNITSKHHVIKYEPIITPGNEGVVHHLVIYRCLKDDDMTILPDGDPVNACDPKILRQCPIMMAGWGVGTGTAFSPDHVGYPIGDDDYSGYVMMEMHYDNPQLASGIYDSSGLRLTYTPELRDNEMGVLLVGVGVTKYHFVPPHAEAFVSAGFCSARCLSDFLEELGQPIHIVGANLAIRLLGVKISARVIHNGTETDIAREDNYDYHMQLPRMLKEEITVYPGGLDIKDELCVAIFRYYPKFNLEKCVSIPSLHTTAGFAGIQDFEFDYDTLELNITAPAAMVGMTYEEAIGAVPWTEEKAHTFSDMLLNGNFHTLCEANPKSAVETRLFDDDLPLPRGLRVAPEDVCSGRTAQETTPANPGPTEEDWSGSGAWRPGVFHAAPVMAACLALIYNLVKP
uniref:DOMON domain-containing protein n=1 Tax=Branchiostoma floridae TaxID=7739 RepID=C3XZU5_BRAFL|eukprot:XP_002610483.1 hypothetical protein BRAFLDRAFT_85624 [Branchiostoma floridae]